MLQRSCSAANDNACKCSFHLPPTLTVLIALCIDSVPSLALSLSLFLVPPPLGLPPPPPILFCISSLSLPFPPYSSLALVFPPLLRPWSHFLPRSCPSPLRPVSLSSLCCCSVPPAPFPSLPRRVVRPSLAAPRSSFYLAFQPSPPLSRPLLFCYRDDLRPRKRQGERDWQGRDTKGECWEERIGTRDAVPTVEERAYEECSAVGRGERAHEECGAAGRGEEKETGRYLAETIQCVRRNKGRRYSTLK